MKGFANSYKLSKFIKALYSNGFSPINTLFIARYAIWYYPAKQFIMKEKPGINIMYYCLTGTFTLIFLAGIIYHAIKQLN